MVVRNSLADIAICAFQLFTFLRTFICQVFNLQLYGFCEKSIVKLNDVSIRAVVGIQSFYAYSFCTFIKFFIDIIEQSPVAGSPSVDTLFYVTYDKIAGIFSTHGFFEQYFKVLPLYGTGILKLINHYMVELSSNLFKDEWRITILNQRIEQSLCVAQKETVRLSVHLPHLFIYASQKAKLIKMLDGKIGTFEDSGESWTVVFCK